jgi:hypothetical protein
VAHFSARKYNAVRRWASQQNWDAPLLALFEKWAPMEDWKMEEQKETSFPPPWQPVPTPCPASVSNLVTTQSPIPLSPPHLYRRTIILCYPLATNAVATV